MYKNKSVCVVVPAYNEETQISSVIDNMPDYIDKIIIIDDASTDNTKQVVKKKIENNEIENKNKKIILIEHQKNQGCGGSLISGYLWAKENDFDIVVRMDGDGQMSIKNLPSLLDPVAENHADYSKGNRLFTGDVYKKMPKLRYFGNAFLSLLTKIASGYWHVADFQSGYTAISKKAINTINWNKMYKRYGQPNDLLIRLNVYNFRVADIPIEPIYNIGEKSGMKIKKVIFTLSWLLTKMFFWRIKEKYIIRDFHPLVFFYILGILFSITSILLFIRLIFIWINVGYIPPINALAALFSFMSASQFILFAMWFDMEANKWLRG